METNLLAYVTTPYPPLVKRSTLVATGEVLSSPTGDSNNLFVKPLVTFPLTVPEKRQALEHYTL